MAEYTLTITDAAGASVSRMFSRDTITIGRKHGDIVLNDTSVSSKHAELHFVDGELTLVDLNSSNGTYVDGRRIGAPVRLDVGALVRFGHCLVKVDDIATDDEDKTSMLSAAQLAEVMSQAEAARQEQAAPAPQTHQPAPQAHQPAPQAHQPAPQAHQPPAQQPAASGYDDYAYDDGSHDAGYDAPAPQQPVSGYPEESQWDDEPAGAPDWAPQDARGQDLAPKPAAAPVPSPAPRRSSGPRVDPTPPGDPSFGACGPVITDAIKGSIDLVKNWKDGVPATWADIQAALKGAWSIMEPNKMTAPLPLLALSGGTALFAILGTIVPALFFLYGLVSLVVAFAQLFAIGGVYIHFARSVAGRPIDIKDAVKRTLADPKTYLVSLIIAGIVAIPGIAGVIVPGLLALSFFIIPAMLIEGRNGVDLNRRSSELFFRDPRRILLTALTFFAGTAVAGGIVGGILGVIPAVGPYLNIVFQAVYNPLVNTFGVALSLWFYFDIRREMETGDPAADTLQRLG